MTSPLAGSRPRHLELQRATSFKTEPDKGENLEVAMLGTVFKKLQDAGLIPAGARMNGKLAEDLDAVLSGRTVVGLPDAFLQKQNTRSNLATSSGLTSKGAAAQGYSRGMVLTTEQDRTTAAFVAAAGPRALKSPAEARIVADEAINGAAVLTGKGDGRRARALLDKTG
ncbi:MAG: hypothetical protein H6Q89_5310, partial [Myxococcaceae bacterium]|nr:hypothetical protein [Myxococcaceae bacterium]